jgi:prepilin signal peptidase PulO-like enzyme (type II secretory pathway)
MKELIIYSVACYSLTFGIIESPNKLIKLFRELIKDKISEKLIICYHCCGFWVSLFLSPFIIKSFDLSFYHSFIIALYGSGIVYLIHVIEDYILSNTNEEI